MSAGEGKTPVQVAVRFTEPEIADMTERALEMLNDPAKLSHFLKLQSVVFMQIIPKLVMTPPPSRNANTLQAGLIGNFVNLAEKVVSMVEGSKTPDQKDAVAEPETEA